MGESGEFAGKITPLRLAEDRQRAERIRDVVDAFARLRGSVSRFVAMLARDAGTVSSVDMTAQQPFLMLLASLRSHAQKAKFGRLRELNRVIERAMSAEAHRDVIFMQSPLASEAALHDAATALERLDAALIGLCVKHVLACHARTGLPATATAAAATRAAVTA